MKCDLDTAQDLILKTCTVLSSEKTNLSVAVGRIAAESHKAPEALPGYDGSLRDGYAVGKTSEGNQTAVFQVIDEVAAGDTRKLHLGKGEAVRIMTGGLIPAGCRRVVSQENCVHEAGLLRVPSHFLQQENSYIYKEGCEIAKGGVVVPKGTAIRAEHQMLLAGSGYESVNVVRKPLISFFCTGSELLTDTEETKSPGQRFSANNHLLSGLISRHGAMLCDQTMVVDDTEQVVKTMEDMVDSGCDLLLSTGGMGPGKFDLIEEAFERCGGQTIYRSLNLRPGKSTLFGKLGNTLFFGLPGPPPAVHLLFHELVRPAICGLQGAGQCKPRKIKAILTRDLLLPKRGLLRLKSGVFSLEDGACLVHSAKKAEVSNCYIFCPATRSQIREGEKVMIHLIDSPLSSF